MKSYIKIDPSDEHSVGRSSGTDSRVETLETAFSLFRLNGNVRKA